MLRLCRDEVTVKDSLASVVERVGGVRRVPFTEEHLTAMRGGLTAEELLVLLPMSREAKATIVNAA